MKLFFIILSFAVLANAVAYVLSNVNVRVRRDVAELVAEPQNAYLAPYAAEDDIAAQSLSEIPNEQSEIQESAVLGENGYEYRTVQRLSLRKRRDVSHLKMHYLPPTNEYLPPVHVKAAPISTEQPQPVIESLAPVSVEELDVGTTEQQQPNEEYLPPVDVKESQISTEPTQPSNEYVPPAKVKASEIINEPAHPSNEQPEPYKEYLPPVNVKESQISTEQPQTSNEYETSANVKALETTNEIAQPSNEYLPPAKLEELPEAPESESDGETFAKTIEYIEPAAEVPQTSTVAAFEETDMEVELPENSGILLEDGYHYKKPADIPNLLPQKTAPSGLFLPPLEEAIAEGPANGESTVLAEDGYHYRAIKRRF